MANYITTRKTLLVILTLATWIIVCVAAVANGFVIPPLTAELVAEIAAQVAPYFLVGAEAMATMLDVSVVGTISLAAVPSVVITLVAVVVIPAALLSGSVVVAVLLPYKMALKIRGNFHRVLAWVRRIARNIRKARRQRKESKKIVQVDALIALEEKNQKEIEG